MRYQKYYAGEMVEEGDLAEGQELSVNEPDRRSSVRWEEVRLEVQPGLWLQVTASEYGSVELIRDMESGVDSDQHQT